MIPDLTDKQTIYLSGRGDLPDDIREQVISRMSILQKQVNRKEHYSKNEFEKWAETTEEDDHA
jgi:hypothetical protein|tara:strand:+ start:2095 stop:2283 length:189 start_codon:yes stop_codon:yes gene_type:complete